MYNCLESQGSERVGGKIDFKKKAAVKFSRLVYFFNLLLSTEGWCCGLLVCQWSWCCDFFRALKHILFLSVASLSSNPLPSLWQSHISSRSPLFLRNFIIFFTLYFFPNHYFMLPCFKFIYFSKLSRPVAY